MSIIKDAKISFRSGNTVMQLIIINVVVFLSVLAVRLGLLISFGQDGYQKPFNEFVGWFAMPYDWYQLVIHPYTLITHFFLHADPFHLLFNMLAMYWFGIILSDLGGPRRVLPAYVFGALTGAAFSFASFYLLPNLWPGKPDYMLGASAGVMAILLAAATLAPDYKLYLIFFGAVSIKYIALVYVVLDLFFLSGGNTGGHLAHIGGALFGWFYIFQLRRGFDMSAGFNRAVDRVKNFFDNKPRPKVRVTYRKPNTANPDFNVLSSVERQRRIDEILDKISKSGYDGLTKEEKEILFKASKD
jgi:membrane associated rhomboid family serine protease